MEFLIDVHFLYLMGVLWLINGSILSLVNTGGEAGLTTFVGVLCLGSWLIGTAHIVYAFYAYA